MQRLCCINHPSDDLCKKVAGKVLLALSKASL
jgi:hypothetical protein